MNKSPLNIIFNTIKNYKVPYNLNFTWAFGAILLAALIIQITSGIFLSMHYVPHTDHAFSSIQNIINNIDYGWLLHYCHVNCASLFFIALYFHIIKNLYYASYKNPRKSVWITGIFMFYIIIFIAFTGYVLQFSQKSFWSSIVVLDIINNIPLCGEFLYNILYDTNLQQIFLNRFFVIHIILPFIIVIFSFIHIAFLKIVGQNNPTGQEVYKIPFHPFYTHKYLLFISIFWMTLCYFIFFNPFFFTSSENYIPANYLKTPFNIYPEWYLLPFYSILKILPNKIVGIYVMIFSLLILLATPWLDYSKKINRTTNIEYNIAFVTFVISVLILSYIGTLHELSSFVIFLGRICIFCYFSYFLIYLPSISFYESYEQKNNL